MSNDPQTLREELQRLREAAHGQQRRLAFLNEATEVLASSLDYATTLECVARLAVPALADWCIVDTVESDGRLSRLVVAHADPAKGDAAAELQRRYPPDPKAPFGVAQVIRTGQPQLTPEFPANGMDILARDAEHRRILTELGIRSTMSVPLQARGKLLGAITFVSAGADRRYGSADLVLAEDLARHAAIAIDNARLYQDAYEARHRYRDLVDGLDVIVWEAVPDPWRFTFVSQRAEQVLGYPIERWQAEDGIWPGVVHPEDRERVLRLLEEAAREGSPRDFEHRATAADGKVVWLRSMAHAVPDAKGAASHLRGAMFDLTERKRAEEALSFVTAHARCLLWHATVTEDPGRPNGLRWDIDVFDEEAAQRFLSLELRSGECYTAAWYRSRFPADQAQADLTAGEALRSGRTRYAQEFRCERRDGEIRWIYEQAYIEPLAPGRWRLAGVCTDITGQKLLEQELTQRARELAAADRSKNEFLAMLAHELRNPLAAIANAGYVLDQLSLEDPQALALRGIVSRQAGHLSRLVDDLLDVSRVARGKVVLRRQPIDLAGVLNRAVESVRPFIESRRHRLSLSLPDSPVHLEADPTRLEQVFVNLLNNAAKYTEPGGAIWLEVCLSDCGVECLSGEPSERSAHAIIQSPNHSNTVLIRVRDTGTGIPPEMLPRIFDLFAQAEQSLERSQGGLGIGLTLVKTLVELHGGAVEARSDGPGRGAEFLVRLPLVKAESGRRKAEGPNPEPETSNAGPLAAHRFPVPPSVGAPWAIPPSKRVLVVEDNPDAAEALRDLLELWECEVDVARSGREALQRAERFAPHVVLLDIGLPEMDGYEVARRLRVEGEEQGAEGNGERPVLIALTGYTGERDRDRSREAGIDLHLSKPVDPEELKRVLCLEGAPTSRPAPRK